MFRNQTARNCVETLRHCRGATYACVTSGVFTPEVYVRDPYPSAEWALLAPLLPPPEPTGRPREWPDRLVADAVFYVLRSGCAWRTLPREFPPWPTVFSRFRRWRLDGTLRRAHDVLRALVRRQAGRTPEPSAATIDSQSAKSAGVGGPARGYDGGKRVKGRKRHVLVDAMGLLLAVCVHAADVQGSPSATGRARGCSPTRSRRTRSRPSDTSGRTSLTGCYTGAFAAWLREARGCGLEVVRHPERQLRRDGYADRPARAFRVLPRRWVVACGHPSARSLGWASRADCRRTTSGCRRRGRR